MTEAKEIFIIEDEPENDRDDKDDDWGDADVMLYQLSWLTQLGPSQFVGLMCLRACHCVNVTAQGANLRATGISEVFETSISISNMIRFYVRKGMVNLHAFVVLYVIGRAKNGH